MVKAASSDTQYTAQVRSLINDICGKPSSNNPSVHQQAKDFFAGLDKQQAELMALKSNLEQLKHQLKQNAAKDKKVLMHKITKAENELLAFQDNLAEEKLVRHRFLELIVEEILALSEGETVTESNRKSAKLLGTLQLLIDTEHQDVLIDNERTKPIYKAVLCLRLLDRLILDKKINSAYIKSRLQDVSLTDFLEFELAIPEKYQAFQQQVKVPIVMAALLQDIGTMHPKALELIYGVDGNADPYRILEEKQRKQLLQINYQSTQTYVVHGIGLNKYIGDFKVEKELFDQAEKEKQVFIRQLLKSAVNPEKGIGNLLKVPQIYVSIVLATKHNYSYKLIPQVYQVLYQNCAKGFCYQPVVDALAKITGMFPQGFGITFIPLDENGNRYDRFEYGIVTQLYPPHFKRPLVRTTTRNLTFISRGQDVEVLESCNLYFPETAKSFAKISKQRLDEILELLASNYQERQKADVLPRCWHAKDYFSVRNHQNLWNKAIDEASD